MKNTVMPLSSRYRSFRCLGFLSSAGVCALLGSGCVAPGPLRPGQEATTGGRTAQSQWEFHDALTQMYQAQVMLNVIRLAEYGEAPLHFEFSDITATIRDEGKAAIGFEFLDSPAGGSAVGSVFVANRDTNVRFTPSLSLGRNVEIQAKATPVTRQNWIYNWYYTVADQFTQHEERKFYRKAPPSEALSMAIKAYTEGRLALWYRGDLYRVREAFHTPLEVEHYPLGSSDLRKERMDAALRPQDELGGLTAILSFLQPSDPRTLTGADVRVTADFDGEGLNVEESRLYLIPHRTPGSTGELQRVEEFLDTNRPIVVVSFPVEAGKPYFERRYQFHGLTDDGRWAFVVHDAKGQAGKTLRDAIKKYRNLPMAEQRVLVDLRTGRPIGLLSLSDAARRIAGAPGLPRIKTQTDLLRDIAGTLQRIESRQD
jgi:hypothetical protein